jgi:hypothetical protein
MKLPCFMIFLLFVSCEGIVDGEGYVYDANTKQPLDSVFAKSYSRHGKSKQFQMEMVTDSTGHFFGTTGLVGCSGECPDLVVELIKSGYATKQIVNPYKDTVYLNH